MRRNAPFSLNVRVILLSFTLLGIPELISGATTVDDKFVYTIQSTTQEITIDGVLSESIWSELAVVSDFWMSYPIDDRKVEDRLQTEVRVTSDENFLYISAVCYGPDNYVIKTLKRDAEFWNGDGFGVVIDPVNEKTNGFTFGVSPAGVQTEYLVTGHST